MKRTAKSIFRLATRGLRTAFPCPLPHAYSQEGEDLILARVFDGRERGFYVDVGAHHPTRFSNTHVFYLKGWRGINIDAMPGSMALFMQMRPGDTNLELAIGEQPGALPFYIFNESALNTFDPETARGRDGAGGYRIVDVRQVEVQTLAQVLSRYLPKGGPIDFLSVDVEGFDLSVLRSNDWARYSPEYVLAEDFSCETVEENLRSPVTKFLRAKGYSLFAKTVHTQIYKNGSTGRDGRQ